MNLAFEWCFIAGILALYFFDSAKLLRDNELVASFSAGKWSFVLAEGGLHFHGKKLCLPGLLTPFAPMFLFSWSPSRYIIVPGELVELTRFMEEVRDLRFLALFVGFQVLLVIPIAIIFFGMGYLFLCLMVIAYAGISALLVAIYKRRYALCLSNLAFLNLVVESIACPPFAINLLRKISLNVYTETDVSIVAFYFFDRPALDDLIAKILLVLDENLDGIDYDEDESFSINGYKNRLNKLKR